MSTSVLQKWNRSQFATWFHQQAYEILFTSFIINSFALQAKKTQDYYTIKYTFPFCHKVSKWSFLLKFLKNVCSLLSWGNPLGVGAGYLIQNLSR